MSGFFGSNSFFLGFDKLAFGGGGGTPTPAISSVNYDQWDVLGGGASIIVTGTDLSGATVDVSGTSATVTGNTSTNVTFTAPAISAGSKSLTITTAGGTSNALTVETWAPTTSSNAKYLVEEPNYVSDVWTPRLSPASFGNLLSTGAGQPPASGGAPNFDGSGYLTSDVGKQWSSLILDAKGTIACVFASTNTESINNAAPYDAPNMVCNQSDGTFGMSVGKLSAVQGLYAHGFDGAAYNHVFVSGSTNSGTHSGLMRWDGSVGSPLLELSLDGGTFATTAFTGMGVSTVSRLMRIGANWAATMVYRGLVKAIYAAQVAESDVFNTKFRKWAQQRHAST